MLIMRALLASCLVLAATATADAGNNEVTVGSFTRALRSPSANALTEDSLDGGSIGYARHLPFEVAPRLELWGAATMLFGYADGTMFQTLTTELEVQQYTVGARARYALHRRVVGNARIDLGTARAGIDLRDPEGHSATDSGWGAITTGSLGLELLAIAHRRFSLGFRLDLGYVVASGIELTAKSAGGDEDTLELDRMESSLGHLELGGRFFSFTVLSSF